MYLKPKEVGDVIRFESFSLSLTHTFMTPPLVGATKLPEELLTVL
jgi:hypothetical protein